MQRRMLLRWITLIVCFPERPLKMLLSDLWDSIISFPFVKDGSVYPMLKGSRKEALKHLSLTFRKRHQLLSWLPLRYFQGIPLKLGTFQKKNILFDRSNTSLQVPAEAKLFFYLISVFFFLLLFFWIFSQGAFAQRLASCVKAQLSQSTAYWCPLQNRCALYQFLFGLRAELLCDSRRGGTGNKREIERENGGGKKRKD